MKTVSVFPRLLKFQKWLGFMILDVNSCSNLAFTGQEQCQGWPSEPRWQQNLLGKHSPTKRLSHNLTTFCFVFFSVLCSDLLYVCYFKMSHLKVISSDRHSFAVFTFPLITHFSSIIPAESQWVSVSSRRDSTGVRLQCVCFPAWMEEIKCVHGDLWRTIQLIYS